MRKGMALVAGLLAIMVIGLISGCGQSVPEVKSAASSPQNLVVKGVVYGLRYVPAGSYFDYQVIAPVAGATVSLVGSFETKSAVTDANGEYVFQNVKNGDYSLQATKEGYQRGEEFFSTESFLFVAGLRAASAKASAIPDGTIFTADIDMYTNPVMRSVTPTPASTIETAASFVITFNKPMDTATVRPQIISGGSRLFAVGDTVGLTSAWSAGDTVLTITPVSPLLPNQNYLLYLASGGFDLVKDKEGNRLATSTSTSYGIPVEEHGDVIINEDYFAYMTAAGPAPTAPSGLSVVISGPGTPKPFSSEAAVGADYADISGTAIELGLNWTASSGNLTGYKVYVSDSPTSNFRLLPQTSSPTTYTPRTQFNTTVANLLTALYGTINIDPLGGSSASYPLINKPTYFKVVAFNGENESASVGTSAVDLVGPRLSANFKEVAFAGQMLNNNYWLPALNSPNNAYIAFREPIDPATVSTANFTIPGVTVNNVTLMTRGTYDLGLMADADYSVLLVETNTDLTGGAYALTVTGVKDLAGNSIVTGTGDTIVL